MLKLKEWRRAEQDSSLALAVDPRHVKSLQRRAAALSAQGMHRAALDDLADAIDADDGARTRQGGKGDFPEVFDFREGFSRGR